MGEFTQTPRIEPKIHMQSDVEPKNVETEVKTDTETKPDAETTDTEAKTGDKTGAEAAQAQGAQTSQQTSADTEADDKKPEAETTVTVEPEKEVEKKMYDTDVAGVKSDDQVRVGSDKFPCFDVSHADFYQNMQDGRRRLRFEKGSNVQKYMQGTKYNRAFYVRHTDTKGKTYVRKIK